MPEVVLCIWGKPCFLPGDSTSNWIAVAKELPISMRDASASHECDVLLDGGVKKDLMFFEEKRDV